MQEVVAGHAPRERILEREAEADEADALLRPRRVVCLGLSLEDALARGVSRNDFLHGTESYKFDWATATRETVAVRIVARGIPAALLLAREGAEAAARAAAHALLPEAAVQLLRRLRRTRERQTA